MTYEFLALEQTTEMVCEIIAKFRERELFCPQYAASEEMRVTHYHNMLRKEIWEHVSISTHKTVSNLVEATRERELELEIQQQNMK